MVAGHSRVGSGGSVWVELDWKEEQPLASGGKFAGSVTVHVQGWAEASGEGGRMFLQPRKSAG